LASKAGGLGLVSAWGVLGDLLAVFIRSARDTFSKEGGDPIDWLYATDPIELLGGKPIWLQRSKVGEWTAFLPSDY
jgi:hypothetical protein